MKLKQLRGVSAAVAGALLMGFGANAMADATFDLVDALVKKGVLTEEEALPLIKGRENDIQTADKKVKKTAKLQVSDAIDNATLYGDVRVRYEYRSGEDASDNTDRRERGRYKLAFGVKTAAGDFYSDLAFAMGPGGRSDNATFSSGTASSSNGTNTKEILYVKRAMVGWNITDWVSVEAGRITNPLYTTQMVWDADLTFEGLAEKFKYNINKTELFANLVQSQYLGDYRNSSTGSSTTTDRITNNVLAFQGGTKFPITDMISGKVALTYTTYTNNKSVGGAFTPGLGTATGLTNTFGSNTTSTNDLRTIEIPGEIEFKTPGNFSYNVFGDYVYNLDGKDRFNAAVAASTGANATAISNAGNDDSAWLLGAGVKFAKAGQATPGDWDAKVWYQDVGTYALDPNAVDSDFMDSRVNMKGIVFKGQYYLRSNVFASLSAGHATRKNDALAATSSTGDVRVNLDKYDLLQFDLTYRF